MLDRRCGVLGSTALHLAAEEGNVGVLEELVKKGAGVSVKDEKGETAKERAEKAWGSDTEVLKRMREWLE